MERGAVVSPCGKYRYRLRRRWGEGPTCAFIMLNPSTADADFDDPTIRRCIGFAKREQCGALLVVNLFAYRATDPDELFATTDPEGPENDQHLLRLRLFMSGPIIAAWGAHPAAAKQHSRIVRSFKYAGLMCLGTTKSGAPRHPLYVKGDAPLTPYPGDRP